MCKTCYFIPFIVLFFLSGCYGGKGAPTIIAASPSPKSTSLVVDTPIASSQADVNKVTQTSSTPVIPLSSTPSATLSPLIPLTPSATPTPTPQLAKQVLIALGDSGGDGGSPYLDYLGRNMPRLILYTDGQIIIREGEIGFYENSSGYVFKHTYLTSNEICSIFRMITDSGFFEIEAGGFMVEDDPIYEFDSSVEFSEGGPSYTILVNGPHPKMVFIYYSYLNYVIDEIRVTYDLLNNYRLGEESYYHPNQVVLWIEEGNDENIHVSQPWPDDLPHLSELIMAMDYDNYEGVLLQDNIESLLRIFEYRVRGMLFKEGDKEYLVTLRSLLPHEPVDFVWRTERLSEFTLPFECEE